MSSNSTSRFKLKRLLEELSLKRGRGTELISLYIPPDRKIHEVLNNLREEYGTASNIKSRTTRKNVLEALEKVTQRLKLFKSPPPNGLVIFCGAIPQNGAGTEKMELYVIEPPEPINIYLYRCDDHFHIEPLFEILKEKETYGIIVIDASEAAVAALKGRRMEILGEYTSGVGGKHRTGGQSARRFERIREMEINNYFRRVGAHINEIFGEIKDLKGIIIGGPGPTKHDFIEGDHLNYMLKNKILGVIDTSYVGESGLEEVVNKSSEILKNVRYSQEKKLVQRFLYEVGHDTGLAAYGENEIRKHLQSNSVALLLLSEKLNKKRVTIKCKNCGYEESQSIEPYELPKIEQDLMNAKCPKCLNLTLSITEIIDIIDEFINLGEKAEAAVEIISIETEEGVMLKESFGGAAAILKYKPS
ncbi:peptide chain release factor aRF-1 [Candidatus Bathyarchaeota archaeon]|nr:peptide chain release factor aRF-1 [Candidatus Bathyarchaeota archaeon]